MRTTHKTLITVVASLTLFTGFPMNTEATPYTLNNVESLRSISQKFSTSISDLKSINNLSGKVIVPYTGADPKRTIQEVKPAHTSYTVQAGDSLWSISTKYNISINELKILNALTSETIYVGQVLRLSSDSDRKIASQPAVAFNTLVVTEAKKQIGTPYKWAGTTPTGFDCSGFIFYVHNQAGVNISRTTAASYYSKAEKITRPEPGDLVFFKDTYKPGISHMGIYVGNNSFVHASSSGVKLTSLSNSYWSKYFAGYGRF